MTNETPKNTNTTSEANAKEFIEMAKTNSKEECNAYITKHFGEFGTENYDEAGHVAFSNEVIAEVESQATDSVPSVKTEVVVEEANEDSTVEETVDVADTAEVEAVESTN